MFKRILSILILLLIFSNVSYAVDYSDIFVLYNQKNLKQFTCKGCAFNEKKNKIEILDKNSYILSPVIDLPFYFEEAVPSWNIECPEKSSFSVFVRFGNDTEKQNKLSPWLLMGEWNRTSDYKTLKSYLLNSKIEGKFDQPFKSLGASIETDYILASKNFNQIQFCFIFAINPNDEVEFSSLSISASTHRGDKKLNLYEKTNVGKNSYMAVPFRSQGWEDKKISSEICSVVSTATVMDYYGVDIKTAELAKIAYDKRYKMYGMWWRAVQSAHQYGFNGVVKHFRSWEDVKEFIDKKMPVIACISVNKNDIADDPNYETDGHVIVIIGFDENGDILCADGGFRKEEDGVLSYKRKEFEKIWFINSGGIGYLITPSKKEILP